MSAAPESSLDELRAALTDAEASTRAAYRDTTRLIRLLTVIGTPASPEELVDRTLSVLSEVYSADVTCVAAVEDAGLHITNACGLPEGDPAFTGQWPVGSAAAEVLRTGLPVIRTVMQPNDVPPSLASIGARVGAWVPLTGGTDSDGELLVLFRRSDEPFTAADLQVLASVCYRMQSAVEARERGEAIEWLARTGPELARHLDLPSLLEEAVSVMQKLTGAPCVWIVTVDDGVAELRAHTGLAEAQVRRWPRPVEDLPEWQCASAGEVYAGRDAPQSTVLSVPVMREGVPVALLCLGRPRPQPFGKTAVEVTTILANYLAAAMSNSELYWALAQSETELRRRATHDPLTGLANRVLASQRIEDALARAPGHGVGLMFCDLDKFKEVNDRLGHEAGDELIQQVAARLERCIRPADLLARFGGDEFVVVIEDVDDLSDLVDLGRRIQGALEGPFLLRGERVHVSASVGGVFGVGGQDSAGGMLRDADAAMYAAKVKGPGRVEVFDEAASHRSMDRLGLRSELLQALDNGQFAVHYQPIVDLRTGEISAFEALLRWHHPRRGAIPPDVFIPMAEETGAIVPMGAWVLDQACRELARWHRTPRGRGLLLSVNVSAIQLAQPDLAKVTLDAVATAGVSPADLWLEVTEHEHIGEDLFEPVAQLRATGVHFTLDDFGMSYSNLSYLQRFPVEGLKVDRSFVADIAERDADRGIVAAIVAIAESLDLQVVAEGVETRAQRDTLLGLGCRLGQGYLLSPALPADAALALIDSGCGR